MFLHRNIFFFVFPPDCGFVHLLYRISLAIFLFGGHVDGRKVAMTDDPNIPEIIET
jgi:hypothetical protein